MAFRKGVYGVVHDGKDNYLLVQNTSYKENEWTLPGGGLDGEETHEEGFIREMREELRLEPTEYKILATSTNPIKYTFPEPLENDGRMYEGQIKEVVVVEFTGKKDTIDFDPNEVKAVRWVSVEQLPNHLIFPNQYQDMEKVLREFGLI